MEEINHRINQPQSLMIQKEEVSFKSIKDPITTLHLIQMIRLKKNPLGYPLMSGKTRSKELILLRESLNTKTEDKFP
ncbi:hypothetical protein HAX54_000368, partial [Datura stramonium]|nr:hypothetical protein [Datura stramonium]